MVINQYNIVLVNLDPTIGSEIQKTRPCLVLSPNEINHNISTIIIAPMTSSVKKYPTRVPINHNNKNGFVAIDQIRTINKQRIIKVFASASKKEISQVKKILKETLID
ncbi:MAG: type II toxin-antitoxin system PemK/MazF family toxin [Flavobacteriaceae bacterium]